MGENLLQNWSTLAGLRLVRKVVRKRKSKIVRVRQRKHRYFGNETKAAESCLQRKLNAIPFDIDFQRKSTFIEIDLMKFNDIGWLKKEDEGD